MLAKKGTINGGNEIARLTFERKQKFTSKSVSRSMSYAKVLIPILFAAAILTTFYNAQAKRQASSMVYVEYKNNGMRTKEQPSLRLPNVLLIGAQKAGTSALARTLFTKFGVCRAMTFEGDLDYYAKEVNYFDKPDRYKQGLEFYSKRFQHCNSTQVAMDATVDYFSGPNSDDVAEKVRQTYDSVGESENLKILVVLREPVARELSMYNMMMKAYRKGERSPWTMVLAKEEDSTAGGAAATNFTEFVDKVALTSIENGSGFGLYAMQLKKWFDRFDRKQILVLSYDELVQDETSFFQRVLQFLDLGIEKPQIHANRVNAGSPTKVSGPECVTQRRLASAFDNSNEELYALLESHPGPPMEQRPFPRFQLGNCLTDGDNKSIMTNDNAEMHEKQTLHLPNALLIGAQKAGTSALAHTLFDEFGVCHAKRFGGDLDYYEKEVNFFNKDNRFKQGLEFYSQRFQHCEGQQVAMDATVDYLSGPNSNYVAERVWQTYDSVGEAENVKIIAVLREPVARELSLYNMKVDAYKHLRKTHSKEARNRPSWASTILKEDSTGGGATLMNFTEYTDEVALPHIESGTSFGLYAMQLKKWFDRFDRKQILILSYDELVKDETAFFQRVLQFLDLTTKREKIHAKKVNTGSATTKVKSCECIAQTRLASAFNNSNEDLYALLESQLGPPMEQRPFPRFQLGSCSQG